MSTFSSSDSPPPSLAKFPFLQCAHCVFYDIRNGLAHTSSGIRAYRFVIFLISTRPYSCFFFLFSHNNRIDTAVAWEALFSFDCVIMSLTMYKSWREKKRSNVAALHDLVGVIVRDGTLLICYTNVLEQVAD